MGLTVAYHNTVWPQSTQPKYGSVRAQTALAPDCVQLAQQAGRAFNRLEVAFTLSKKGQFSGVNLLASDEAQVTAKNYTVNFGRSL